MNQFGKKNAIFFDRDGVLNENIYNINTKDFESPLKLEELKIKKKIITNLKKLNKKFFFFIITNQPSAAKRKNTIKDLKDIKKKFLLFFKNKQISFKKYYVCYNSYENKKNFCSKLEYCFKSKNKICKKPSNKLLELAIKKFNISRQNSWFVGDRITDILCSKKSRIKNNIFINSFKSKNLNYISCKSSEEALKIILNECEKNKNILRYS